MVVWGDGASGLSPYIQVEKTPGWWFQQTLNHHCFNHILRYYKYLVTGMTRAITVGPATISPTPCPPCLDVRELRSYGLRFQQRQKLGSCTSMSLYIDICISYDMYIIYIMIYI